MSTKKQTKDFLIRIFKNSTALCEEARLLHSHKHFRRSAFLAIAGFEEIQKIALIVKEPTNNNIHFHREKLKHIEKIIRDAISGLILDAFAAKLPRDALEVPSIKAQLSAMTRDVSNAFSPIELRKALLYEDRTVKLQNQFANNRRISKRLSSLYLGKLESHLTQLSPLFKKTET